MFKKTKYIAILACTAALMAAGCATTGYISPIVPSIPGFYHAAKKGETVWRISKMYGINLDELVSLNHISDATRIETGQLIFIPGEKKEPRIISTTPVAASQYDPDEFIWPAKGKVISTFGQTFDNMLNRGINIIPSSNPDILASRPGKVVFYNNDFGAFGKTIIIDHGDGFMSVYARNSEAFVRPGDAVQQGKVIAKAGHAGKNKNIYLHFEIRKGSASQNPLFYLP